jgi:serine/threonine-protein kinase
VQNRKTHDDIWIVEVDGDREPKRLLYEEYGEYNPTFSPNGRWIAYVSYESGKGEIYLQEYTDGGRKEPVSAGGGMNPGWSRDGRELFYIAGKSMMVVEVTTEPDFGLSAPKPLFEMSDDTVTFGNLGASYDVSEDGRFLMIEKVADAEIQLVCVQNWFEELKRIAPVEQN